jgi:hypothetical protein
LSRTTIRIDEMTHQQHVVVSITNPAIAFRKA